MDNPTIAFGLEYAGELVFCEAIMHDRHFEIFFDGVSKGTIEYTENFEWIQASGGLISLGAIKEIGFRIESYYK